MGIFKPATKETIITVVVVSILAIIIYSNSLSVPFQYDGISQIRDNPDIHSFSLPSNWHRATGAVTFALNYKINGLNTEGYHLFNILIHIFNALILFLFVRKTLSLLDRDNFYSKYCSQIAFTAALLFVVNPVHTGAVTYIYQRSTEIVFFFYILSMYFYAKMRTSRQFSFKLAIPLAITIVMAFMSKANSAMLPLFLVFYEIYFIKKIKKKTVVITVLAGAILVLAVFPFITVSGNNIFDTFMKVYNDRNFTPEQRLMTESRVVSYYLGLLAFPHPDRLRAEYGFKLSTSLVSPLTTIISFIFIAFCLFLAIYFFKKDKVISFAILWYFGNLAIESTIIPLKIAFEHRLYLPSLFIFVLMGALIIKIGNKWQDFETGTIRNFILRREYAVLLMIIFVFGFWTYARNEVWKTERSLWEDALKKSPNQAVVHAMLGEIELKQKNLKKAELHFLESIKLNPNNPLTYSNLGITCLKMNRYGDAEKTFKRAIKEDANLFSAHEGLGRIYLYQGKYEDAITEGELALSLKKYPSPGELTALGQAYQGMGNFSEAEKKFSQAIKIAPAYSAAYEKLASLLIDSGKYEKAIEIMNRGLKRNPSAELHNLTGTCYGRTGNIKMATEHLKKAVTIDRNNADYLYNLAYCYEIMGDVEKALELYRQTALLAERNPAFKETASKARAKYNSRQIGNIDSATH